MTIEEQLQSLRDEWIKRRDKRDIKGMKIIEIQGKLLKMKGEPDTLDIANEVFGGKIETDSPPH